MANAWLRRSAIAALFMGLHGGLCGAPAAAEGYLPDAPVVTQIAPPSGQRGTTVQITLGGQKLSGTKELLCRYSAYPALIPPADRGLQAEVTTSEEGQVKANLVIAKDAPPGLHQIQAVTARGITVPFYFFVSQYAQVPEKDPNNERSQAQALTLPVTVAGLINGGEDQDWFSFSAKQGERLIFDVEGFKRFAPAQNQQEGIVHLDSFISLRDAAGNELAYDDDSTRLDAFLAYQFPADGTYYLVIRDSLYRGRGDFHYRLTIGNRPTITAIFPPSGPRGSRLVTTVYGYNLDASGATSVKRAVDLSAPGAQEFRLTTSAGTSNPVPVISGPTFEEPETEPNDRIQDTKLLTVPITVTGKFDRLDDVDGFRFLAQGNQPLVFEVQASRLGSPVDTFLTLMDRGGRVIARDDDGGGMPDARLQTTIPRADEYVVFVRNQIKTGSGPEHFYRLTIRPLQPRFTVVMRQQGQNRQGQQQMVDVSSLAVPQGGKTEFEVAIGRIEGQSGDVSIAVNAPPGAKEITMEPAVIKNGQNSAKVTLMAAETMPVGTYRNLYLRVSGLAGAQPFRVDHPLWVTVAPKE